MKTLLSLFEMVLFTTEMLALAFFACIRMPKRKLFILRFVMSVAVSWLVTYYSPKLIVHIMPFGVNPAVDVTRAVVNCFVQFALVVATMKICWDLTWKESLFIGSFCYFIQHTAYCLNAAIHTGTSLAAFNEITASVLRFLRLFVFDGIVFGIAWLIFWRKADKDVLKKLYMPQIMPMLAVILVVCIIFNNIEMPAGGMVVFHLTDMVCNIVCMCCQYTVMIISVLRSDKQKMKELLEQNARQYCISKQNIELINIKCHDLRHQFRNMQNEGNMSKQSLSEIKRIIDQYDCVLHVGNPVLDVILTEKSMMCKEHGIEFTCLADGANLPKMDECDVYSLFGNAIDNAIEAAKTQCAADKKFISVNMSKTNKLYFIQIQNYTGNKVSFVNGMPVTSKPDTLNHGFGTKSIKMIAEKYGGEVTFGQSGEIFKTNIILPCVA